MRYYLWAAILIVGSGVSACSSVPSSAGESAPPKVPDITGTITQVDNVKARLPECEPGGPPQTLETEEPLCAPEGVLGKILIEEDPKDWGGASGSDKAYLTIMEDTEILRRQGEKLVSAGFEDVKVGQSADAWFGRFVGASYPLQTDAETLVFEPDGESQHRRSRISLTQDQPRTWPHGYDRPGLSSRSICLCWFCSSLYWPCSCQ